MGAGASPAMIIRVAANIAELRKNLADGTSTINVTTAGMQKLAGSLDGSRLFQQAQNITAAVQSIGGASKLTEAEQARLNVTLEKALAKYQALGKEAPPGMQELATATRKIATETETASSKTGSWKSQLTGLAGAFGITFSIGAVVAFGREILKMGDEIVRVADRTGLTTTEVQKLSYVAEQSGNSIDELTGAIGQMQNRLASGDKSAVAAVRGLHLSFTDLAAASPAKQLEMIATEIGKIPDPAERTRVAMDLFGKSGTAILPTLTAQFKTLADQAPVMSDKTVRALDAAGDSLNRFGRVIKVWAAEAYNYLGGAFDTMAATIYKVVASLLETTVTVLNLAAKIPWAGKAISALGIDMKGLSVTAQFLRDTAAGLAPKLDGVTEVAKRLSPAIRDAGDAAGATAGKVAAAAADMAHALWTLQDVSDEVFGGLLLQVNGRLLPALNLLPPAIGEVTGAGLRGKFDMSGFSPQQATAGMTSIRGTTPDKGGGTMMGDLFASVPGAIQAAIQGGGSKLQAAGGAIGSAIFGPESKLTGTITSGIDKLFGAGGVMAKTLGSLVPMIGPMIGPAIAAIGKLFGKSEESAKVSPLRNEFFKLSGGLEELNPKVLKLTGNLGLVDNILKAKTVDQYNAAMTALKDTLDFQDASMKTLADTAARYGFTLEELGPALQRQNLDTQAQGLFQDWQVLAAGGIDLVHVAERMSGSINDYLHNALATGQEVPVAMQPMLQKMADMGLLTDAAGNTIADLQKGGITFAETMSQGFDRVVQSVLKLTDSISRGLGLAIADIPDGSFTVHGKVDLPPNFPTGDYALPDVYPQAAGGDYLVSRPTLFLAGETGRPERATFTPQGGDSSASGGGMSTAAMESELQQIKRLLKDQPRAMKLAFRELAATA